VIIEFLQTTITHIIQYNVLTILRFKKHIHIIIIIIIFLLWPSFIHNICSILMPLFGGP